MHGEGKETNDNALESDGQREQDKDERERTQSEQVLA